MGARRAVEGVGELFGYFQHRETADSDHRDLMYVGAPADEFVDRALRYYTVFCPHDHRHRLRRTGFIPSICRRSEASRGRDAVHGYFGEPGRYGRFRNVFRPCCRLEVSGDITDISGSKPSAPTNTGDAYPKGWKDALWADEKQMFDAIADGLDSNGSAETVTHHIDRLCRQLRQKRIEPESVRTDASSYWPAGRAEAGFTGDVDDEDLTCAGNGSDTRFDRRRSECTAEHHHHRRPFGAGTGDEDSRRPPTQWGRSAVRNQGAMWREEFGLRSGCAVRRRGTGSRT